MCQRNQKALVGFEFIEVTIGWIVVENPCEVGEGLCKTLEGVVTEVLD